MQTSLLAIANKAKDRKQYRFLNLYRLIGDENFLLERSKTRVEGSGLSLLTFESPQS